MYKINFEAWVGVYISRCLMWGPTLPPKPLKSNAGGSGKLRGKSLY